MIGHIAFLLESLNDSPNKIAMEPREQPMGCNLNAHRQQPNEQHEHSEEREPRDGRQYIESHARRSASGLGCPGYKRRDYDLPITAIKRDDADFDL